MTRDLYPLVVIDRAVDIVLKGSMKIGEMIGGDRRKDEQETAEWCDAAKKAMKESQKFRDHVATLYDHGLSVESAATLVTKLIAVAVVKKTLAGALP